MNRLSLAALQRLTAAVLLATLLSACGGGEDVVVGGGGGSNPPPAPGGTSVGATGGTVSLSGGPSVVVPAGALTSATAILIEKVTTGAPAMPAGMAAAGDLYAITPHGTSFQQPVMVSLPVPNVSLAANQQLMMAKAEPNGTWVVLGDTVISGSTATAPVVGFSYFTMVIVRYSAALDLTVPFQFRSAAVACSNQPCEGFIGTTTATYTFTTNGGQLPADCPNPLIQVYTSRGSGAPYAPIAGFGGGQSTSTITDVSSFYVPYMSAQLWCRSAAGDLIGLYMEYGLKQLQPNRSAGEFYPAIHVDRMPAQLDVVAGNQATLEAILSGGASKLLGSEFASPTAADRAVMDWQRSGDNGKSWQPVARSYQDEGDSKPLNSPTSWRHWTASHSFIASSSDDGALLRVIACYTPPAGTTPPPCATGAATRINVIQQAALPAVTSSSDSMLVQSGQSATLVAATSGLPAPTLQWQSRPANGAGPWVNIAGATTATYVTPTLSTADNGTQYRVVATNTLGAAQGPVTIVSVSDLAVAPFITTQPASIAVTAGSDAAFAVAARGTELLAYQWRKGSTPITGATTAVLRLATVAAGDAGSYSVTITNSAGTVTSAAANLVVTSATPPAVAPTIITQPAALTVSAGNSATFAVGVNGTGPFNYQWRKDGAPITGATSAAYTLGSISAGDAGSYTVVVGNGAGNITSNAAVLTLASPGLPPVTTPLIVTNPSTVVVAAGASATLAAQATGSAPLSYQWNKSGTPIGGATSAVLVLSPVTTMDAGSYSVTVSNAAGSATSASADIILLGAPVITVQPQAVTATEGATATFSVTATGQALHYAWLRNGVEIAGATSAFYTTPTLLLADDGALYSVTVYNGSGLKFSNAARLSVNQAPPSALSYASPQSYPTGSAITALNPTVTGVVTGYSVSPALPAGLALNTSNGAITGTPTATTAQATYRITATGPGGSANFDLVLTITAPATGSSLSWTTPLRLDTGSLDIMNPQVAVDPAGNAMAIWMQWDGSIWSVWAARHTAAGNSWASPTRIQLDLSSRAQDPKLVMDAAGNAFATWYQDSSSPSTVWAARFDAAAGTWDTALSLQSFAGDPLLTDIVADSAGNAVAVWWNIDAGGAMRLVQRQYDVASHAWGTATVNAADVPRIRIGYPEVKYLPGNSTALVIWSQQSAAGGNEVRSSTITIGTGVGATWNATSSQVATTFASRARIAVDASGIATAVYANGAAVGAARLDTNIVNPLWTAPVAIEYAGGDVADRARVAVDAAGNAIAVWEETAPGNVMRSVARRFDVATGNWDAGVTFISTTTGDGGFPSVRFDAAGNAIAMLNSDSVFNSSNIYARRYAAGSWESDDSKVSLAVSPNSAVTPEFVLDANGKAMAVWRQQTGSNTAVVYFSRNP